MKLNFDKLSDEQFARLEDKAIDGQLDYSEFPPDEYKYFSKLAQLGYKNRHNGWSAEICEEKKNDFKKQYLEDRERRMRFYRMACRMQANIRRGEMLISNVYKSKTPAAKLKYALQALELITCEEGLAKRNGA